MKIRKSPPPRQVRLSTYQKKELETWRRYLANAEQDLKEYGDRDDLIGRGLKDIRDRFADKVARAARGEIVRY